MGYSHCVVQHHCVKLDLLVSLTSLAEWRVCVSIVTFARYFPFTCAGDSSLLHVGGTHVVNSAIASLGPSGKASLPGLPAGPPCRAASAECGIPTSAECF